MPAVPHDGLPAILDELSAVGCSGCGGTGEVPCGPWGGARCPCPKCGGKGSVPADEIERPWTCPAPGVVDAFDAGWEAHAVGLDRVTVSFFAHPSGRGWALLAWDVRQKISEDDDPQKAAIEALRLARKAQEVFDLEGPLA